MGKDTLLKIFAKYVSQSVLGVIGLSCYIIADTFFIAKGLGSNGLTALNLSISVYSFIFATGLMTGIGGATRYSILKAQGQSKNAEDVFAQAVRIGLLFGTFFLLVGLFFSGTLSRLLGADDITFEMTNTYIKIILLFAPCFILNNILNAFVRNDGNPRIAMAAMLTGSISNIILDYVFIFPMRMGMAGAAIATVLAPIISMCVISTHFIKRKWRIPLVHVKIKPGTVLDIFALGLPSLITEISAGIVVIVFNLIILKLAGNTGVAAYGVVANYAIVATAVFGGIAQGIQPIISRLYGEGNGKFVKRVFRYALILSVSIFILIYCVIIMMPDILVSLFNSENDTELAAMARSGLLIYFTGYLFAGVNTVTSSFFTSVGQPSKGFAISVIRGCAAIIPLVFLLSAAFGMNGVWLSFACAEFVAFSVAVIYFKHKNNRII